MPNYSCGPIRTHHGIRDASAAVTYRRGTTLFLVASDEDQQTTHLRLYDTEQDGPPVREFALPHDFLSVDPQNPEIDLEGATWMGSRIYWIASHSRTRDGEYRPSRHRLFATELRKGVPTPVGRVYKTLVQDLGLDIETPAAPKEGGLSIEGLSATGEPGELIIGVRSPLIVDKAILITLRNADEVIYPGVEPEFGTPILLDLGGNGIRSIDYWPERDLYLIIAGPATKTGEDFRLYLWSGSRVEDLNFDFAGLGLGPGVSAEGLLIEPASETVYLFFDEGNRKSPEDFFRSVSIHGL
jgi:hypothetical protein